MAVTIVADQGSHLLISKDNRFAIVERRDDRLYNCHDGKRDSIALDHISEISLILQDTDWVDQAAARSAFDEIVAHGTHLSQHML